ncbi:hypothetical protein PLICRDRAFT_28624 [Plicaturopsis crispa FD-325 SS-3]|nr:hypothetical protein PLICRDRAFT_28624 [Plicaturopsis crispa FD-325 SS-3]
MSPISQETAARSDAHRTEPVLDDTSAQPRGALNPEEVAPPTQVHAAPQQASTSPGDGSEVQEGKLPFKEQVVAYAKVTRGTLLGKHDLKEHGEKILDGQETVKGEQIPQ